jgi:DNA-binding NtrC family response regulator
VSSGAFREDLYYRLNVVPLQIPPLRERRGDIPLLVDHILGKFRERLNKDIEHISDEALAVLCDHTWPGNIRELENVLERTILFCNNTEIGLSDLPEELRAKCQEGATPAAAIDPDTASSGKGNGGEPSDDEAQPPGASQPEAGETSLKDAVRAETNRVEKEMIAQALDKTTGNVTQAAKLLKISRKSLQTKMKDFGLRDREGGS